MTGTLETSGKMASPHLRTFSAGTLSLSFREEGEGPLVVLLHGFPDTAATWIRTQRILAASGYRSAALHMRGYAPSDIPADGDYSIRRLAEDGLEPIEFLSEQKAAIVGHDWGALAAYAAAAIAPESLSCIAALAIPPPKFIRASFRERLARPHNVYLKAGSLATWWLRRRNFREIDRLYKRWSPNWPVPVSHLATVKAALAQPGRARAAVDYYAAKSSETDSKPLCNLVGIPTLIVYGADEPKVRREMFDRASRAIRSESKFVELSRTGHWPHLESPDEFERELLAFLTLNRRRFR